MVQPLWRTVWRFLKKLIQFSSKPQTNSLIKKWIEGLNRHFSKEDLQMARAT